ncbi:MAG: FAD-dependent oxidoreductase [Rhodospirillales bacterium]|tara:strand:+ start:4399 stop:6045 length:1647 start_codon:yes stop_codon:yes gene_type:complete
MNRVDTDVIIVGGGPCGLMLANELGQRGISVIVFNEREGTSPLPQANATQARTMEHFRRLGFASEIRKRGLPPDYPTDITYFTRYTKHELARFALPSSKNAEEAIQKMRGSWSAAELPHRISQMFVEEVLYEQALRIPSVELKFGKRVNQILDDGNLCKAIIGADGQEENFISKYLVGCDGPRSLVRKYLNIELIGESGEARDFMGGRMHAIYFQSDDLYQRLNAREAWMYWAFNGDRRSFMAAIDGKSKFVFHTQLKPEEEKVEISDAKARSMFFEAFGDKIDIKIISRLSWTAGLTLVANSFNKGRIFIAGDAAHLFTPTGGLGYNTGIEDAVNLGWKLAAVLKGWGQNKLLDSYNTERHQSALRNTSFARQFADSIGKYKASDNLEDETVIGKEARKKAGDYLSSHARAEFNIPGITFGYRYDGSSVLSVVNEVPPPDKANEYQPSGIPGGRAPHFWIDKNLSIYDKFGFDFTLICFRVYLDIEAVRSLAIKRSLPIKILELYNEEIRATYGASFVLIRPDQIICWRGENFSNFESIISTVTGRK